MTIGLTSDEKQQVTATLNASPAIPLPSGKSDSIWAGVTKYHLLVFFGCWMGGIFDGMDSNLFSVMLPNAITELSGSVDKNIISQIGSHVTFVFLLGWMLGGVVFGVIGDKLGRVKSMVFSILLYAIFTGVAGLAQTPWQLEICRFLTGLGIGGELVSIATLLSETWPERSRALAVGALITSYQFGVLLSGIITNTGLDWRTVFFIGAVPALLVIFLQTKLHEPEKWTEDQARQAQETEKTMPLSAIFQKGHARNVIIGSTAFGGLLIGYWASLAWIPTWIHDMIGDGATTEKSIATIYHAVAAILGCLMSGPFANAFGRRGAIMFSFLGAFVASAMLFLTNHSFSPAIYWQDGLLGFFIGMNQASLYIYLPELFPTRLRATAVGFCLNVGRSLSAVCALFVGVLVVAFGGYAMAAFTFAVPYLIGLAAALVGQETKGQVLPD